MLDTIIRCIQLTITIIADTHEINELVSTLLTITPYRLIQLPSASIFYNKY